MRTNASHGHQSTCRTGGFESEDCFAGTLDLVHHGGPATLLWSQKKICLLARLKPLSTGKQPGSLGSYINVSGFVSWRPQRGAWTACLRQGHPLPTLPRPSLPTPAPVPQASLVGARTAIVSTRKGKLWRQKQLLNPGLHAVDCPHGVHSHLGALPLVLILIQEWQGLWTLAPACGPLFGGSGQIPPLLRVRRPTHL